MNFDRSPDESLPRRICLACAKGLPVDGAGISLMSAEGHLGTVASSDAAAAEIEDLQFALGEGPCKEAFRTGGAVLVTDVLNPAETLGRWPGFTEAAGRAGVRAVFALPMQIGAIRIGVIDLHRLRPGALTAPELAAALMVADAAALSLLDMRGKGQTQAGDHDHENGAAYRHEVHQATGMLMVQLGVSIDEAFVRLRAYAFANGAALSQVAGDIVARRLAFGGEGGRGD